MADGRRYIDMLEDILVKQISTLESIKDVTGTQSDIVCKEVFDNESFAETLNKKDVLIARLNELDDGFASIYNKVHAEVKDNPQAYASNIRRLQEMIRKCTDLGTEIKVMENRNKDKVEQCFSGKKQEYSAKQTAANVANKYSVTMRNVNLMGESYRFNQDK